MLWLKKNAYKISDYHILTCVDESNIERNVSIVNENLRGKGLRCLSISVLYFAVSGNLFLLLCIGFVLLLTKFQADVFYIFARIRRCFRKHKSSMFCEKKFHAFVTYGDFHYRWAVYELRARLMRDGFRLLLPDLDFEPGKYHVDNIMDAIDNSRRVIFVITREFLSDEWCDYQMQIARCHAFRNPNQNFIIVILRDDIALHEIPKSLQKIWIRVNCIRWPIGEEKKSIGDFWKKLRDGLCED